MNTNGNYTNIGPSQNSPQTPKNEISKEKEKEPETLGTSSHIAHIKKNENQKNTPRIPNVSRNAFAQQEKTPNLISDRSKQFAQLVKFWSNMDKPSEPLSVQIKDKEKDTQYTVIPRSKYTRMPSSKKETKDVEKEKEPEPKPAYQYRIIGSDKELEGKEKEPEVQKKVSSPENRLEGKEKKGPFSSMPKLKLIFEVGDTRLKMLKPKKAGEGAFKATHIGKIKIKAQSTNIKMEQAESKASKLNLNIPYALSIPHARSPTLEISNELMKEMNQFELEMHKIITNFIETNKDNKVIDCSSICAGIKVTLLSQSGTPLKEGLLTEYKNGGDLEQLEGKLQLTIQEKITVSLNIANALFALHEAGIVHRDIKKDNILIEVDEKGKFVKAFLSDMGTCERIDQFTNPSAALPFRYLPPEYLGSIENLSNVKVDDYEFGTLLYFLFCNDKNKGFPEPEGKFTHEEYVQARGACDSWPGFKEIAPEEIKALIRGLTQKNPIERMATDEAMYVLEELQGRVK